MGKSKIITYVVVAALVLAGFYWVYGLINQTPEAKTEGVVVSTVGVNTTTADDQTRQFVSALNDIDNIDLQNRSILDNKIFTALKDFGRTIEERAIGRANPFSPLAGGAGIVTGGGTSSTSSSTDQ